MSQESPNKNFEAAVTISVECLEKNMLECGIDLSAYGTKAAKTIDHLKKEIEQGESIVFRIGNEIVRKTTVGTANIFYTDEQTGERYVLVETKQVFTDGRTKERALKQTLSEKMKPDENPEDVVVRGIEEELGITDIKSIESRGSAEETADTGTYPGVKSVYKVHAFEVHLDQAGFSPQGYQEVQNDKTTYFEWRKVTELSASSEQEVLPYKILENGEIQISDPMGALTVSKDRTIVRVYSPNWINEESAAYNGHYYQTNFQGEIAVPIDDLDPDTLAKVSSVLKDVKRKNVTI